MAFFAQIWANITNLVTKMAENRAFQDFVLLVQLKVDKARKAHKT